MRNELHFRLKELHRLVQCSLFSLARDQKELCLLQAGESRRMLSSQIPDEFKLVAHPGGCCPLWGLSPRLLSRSTVREKKAARRRRRSVDEISLLPRLEPLRSVRTDALEVAYFEVGPSVLITSSSTSTRSTRAVTSPPGKSRNSSRPRSARRSNHCASWGGDGGHDVCPSSPTTE